MNSSQCFTGLHHYYSTLVLLLPPTSAPNNLGPSSVTECIFQLKMIINLCHNVRFDILSIVYYVKLKNLSY